MIEKDSVEYLLLPCGGLSGSGQTTVQAAASFAQQKNCALLSIAEVATGTRKLNHMECLQVVVIDGCDKRCASAILTLQSLEAQYSLCLSELGIAHRPEELDLMDEDIELARDGIESVCAEVGDSFPRINGGCCCG